MIYVPMMPPQNFQPNPWALPAQQDAQTAGSGVPQGQQNLMTMMNQYGSMQGQDAYPTFPNSAGVGTQTGFQPPAPENAMTPKALPQQAQQPNPMLTSSNPWIFSGPALSR